MSCSDNEGELSFSADKANEAHHAGRTGRSKSDNAAEKGFQYFNSDESVKKASGYLNGLLDRLQLQRKQNPEMCDMVITVDDEKFHVHKCLMIASCDYFDAMSRSGMQETRSASIELKGVSAQGLNDVIDFIYSGELRLSMNNIGDILRAVSHLQVQFALKLCEEYLIEETTADNCIEMLNLAEMFCINNVKNAVNNYVLRNFEKLISNEQYKRFTLEQMCFYLQSNKLKLYPEIQVFRACVNWLRHNGPENGPSSTYQLMQYVRFCTMAPEEFVDIVAKSDVVKSDPKCNELLIEAYEYFALPNRQYCSSSPRSLIRNEPVMVCVNESMYILNRREEIWQYLCHSQASCKTISQKFVVVNNFLYACGGYSESNRETCDKCHRFDPRTGQWYSIASMNEKRQFFTLASSNECIVAVGGVFGNVGNFYATIPVRSPLEVYSIEKDTWTSLKDCKVPILKWPGACIFTKRNHDSKFAFIVGGKLTDTAHHSLSQESFIVDLTTSEVEVCSPPITNRFNPSVFFDPNDNKIILFGGEDEKYRLAPCIEIFDLNTKQWSEVATIPVSLSYQCISSTSMIQSKIYYLLEEHDGPCSESYSLKSAYFDINTWQFEVPVQLPHPSTLASKWCSLVFPRKFLEKCQALSSSNDDSVTFDEPEAAFNKAAQNIRQRSKQHKNLTNSASMYNCSVKNDFGHSVLNDDARLSTKRPGSSSKTSGKNSSTSRVSEAIHQSLADANRNRVSVACAALSALSPSLPSFLNQNAAPAISSSISSIPERETSGPVSSAESRSNSRSRAAFEPEPGALPAKPRSLHQSLKASKNKPKKDSIPNVGGSASVMNMGQTEDASLDDDLGLNELHVRKQNRVLRSTSSSENELTVSNDESSK